jgi:hypothetical protein
MGNCEGMERLICDLIGAKSVPASVGAIFSGHNPVGLVGVKEVFAVAPG